MLTLLKYDLKRDQFMLLGGMIALLLALLTIELGGRQINIETNGIAVLSFMTYSFFGILLLIAVCNSFRASIRSVGRRLVPLGSIHYVGAALLYALLLSAVLLAIAGLHLLYYKSSGILRELEQSGGVTVNWNSSLPLPFGIVVVVLWSTLFLVTMLLLVMAVTESLKFKGRSLIGLVIVVLLSSVISWAKNAFFGGVGVGTLPGFHIENQSQMTMQSQYSSIDGFGFVFELVVAALFIWAAVKLIDRKVRIE
ncbi:hypothetical protein [Saccharibacillus alkalitolerans]|uniref:ABC transporter permease n=1 Tax=Saccharibacillus alkalitolerans TaxID=2705290 RepID=A0ABX0F991_9BACL|nr:hypothetical protein [Saccharibacillus alkalitolerans]NGZ75791.1 hypothetical protein [Saccharibacillus alkalitolerans]